MYYYLIPKQKVDANEVVEFLYNTQCNFKYNQYTNSKNKNYLWSVFFDDKYNEQNISIYLSFFYKEDGNNLEGVRVLVHNPTVVKEETLQEQLDILLKELLSLSKEWEIFDLFSNEAIEIPILDSIQQYSSMFRSALETIYAEDQRDRSLYIRIMRLDMPKILRNEQTIDNLIEEISKIKNEEIQKLFIYHLATHIKDCTLSTKQFTALHKLLNKYDCINNDLAFVSKLNLYIHEYAIYRKETVNTGKLFVKQFRDRANLSDYMYALLVEYFHQRKQYEQFFEVALEDYDTYGSEYSRQYLKENLKRLGGKDRFRIFLKISKSNRDNLFLNKFIPNFLILLTTIIPFLISCIFFIIPHMIDENTLLLTLNTDILWGIFIFSIINILLSSILATVINLSISSKSKNLEKTSKVIYTVTAVFCLLIMLCSLFPMMYAVSTTTAYIKEDEIGSNGFNYKYEDIYSIRFILIEPEEICPNAEQSTRYPCLYEFEIYVTQKASEERLLWRDYIYEGGIDRFILKDDSVNKHLLEEIKNNNTKIETNFDETQLDNAKIPESYKKILKQFL